MGRFFRLWFNLTLLCAIPAGIGCLMYDNPKVPGPAMFIGLMVFAVVGMFFVSFALCILRSVFRWIFR